LSHAKLSLANTSLCRERKILRFVIIHFEIKGDSRTKRIFLFTDNRRLWAQGGRKGVGLRISPTRCSFINQATGFWPSHIDPLQWGSPRSSLPLWIPNPTAIERSQPAGLGPHASPPYATELVKSAHDLHQGSTHRWVVQDWC